MGSRDRKRAERRKRKERSGERRVELTAKREERAARTEARNQAARDELEPLERGERPAVVTVAAAIATILAAGTVVAYAIGLEVGQFDDIGNETGEARPSLFVTGVYTLVLGAMAYGLWRARYWAVLGFQTVLVLIIVLTVFGLIQVSEPLRALGLFAVLVVASVLFYRMVKAMARIQMPERRAPG